MNEDNEQAGTCDHGSWSLRGERLARVRALGCVAGETDKPKDYEPTLEYSFFRSTARLSVEEGIFRGRSLRFRSLLHAVALAGLRARRPRRRNAHAGRAQLAWLTGHR